MSESYIYRTLTVPLSFGANDIFNMINDIEKIDTDFGSLMYPNCKSYMEVNADKYILSEEEINDIEFFEMSSDGQRKYKESLLVKRYLKGIVLEILGPIAYKTFSYPSYRPLAVSKEDSFYIVCSGGKTYSEDSSPQSAGIRLIKSMNFKQLRLV